MASRLMGSAGFLIIFAAVNLAARLAGTSGRARMLSLAGAGTRVISLAALIAYAAAHIPAQLAVPGRRPGGRRHGP